MNLALSGLLCCGHTSSSCPPPSPLSLFLPVLLLFFLLSSSFFTNLMFLLLFRWMWGLRMQATACKKTPLSLFSLLLGGSVQVGRQNEKCWCLFLERTSRAQIASTLKGRSPDSSQYISEPGSSWDVHLGEMLKSASIPSSSWCNSGQVLKGLLQIGMVVSLWGSA